MNSKNKSPRNKYNQVKESFTEQSENAKKKFGYDTILSCITHHFVTTRNGYRCIPNELIEKSKPKIRNYNMDKSTKRFR